VFGEQPIRSGAFVESERLAFAQHFDSSHGDVHQRGIEIYSGAAGGCEDTPPVGIAARECGFYERGSGDSFGNFARGGFALCAANFNFDDALRAFAVGDDLLRE